MPKLDQQVAVSYSWKEENDGANAKAVESFCDQLRTAGIPIIRDIDRLKHGQCISEFMRSIGASDFLCVFLSDAYLKSPNCMNEMLVAWQRSKDNPAEFRQRVKVWVMPGAKNIRIIEERLEFLDYWLAEKNRIEPLMTKYAVQGLSGATLDEFKRIKAIGSEVEPMLKFFADTLSPRSVEEFQAWIQAQFLDSSSTSSATDPAEDPELPRKLRDVFGEQFKELERVLEGNQALRDELVRRFRIKSTSQMQVTAELMLHVHTHFLEAIGEFIDIYRSAQDKSALIELVSTVLFLAMCPDYASTLLGDAPPQRIAIAETARQGIAEILICWTHGKKSVQVKALSPEKSLGLWETTSQMGMSEVKRVLMDRMGIDIRAADADLRLEVKLQTLKHIKTPAHFALTEADERLISEIRAAGSPLRDLLLFIKTKGQTINPRGEHPYEMRVESHMDELRKLFNQP